MRINILHLTPHLEITCGISRSIFNIIKSINEFNHFVMSYGGDAERKYIMENINFQKICKYPMGIRFFSDFIRIYFFCKNNSIDIIHSHHRYFDFLSWIVSKVIKVNTVTSVRSKVQGKKYFSYNSDYLVAVSNSIKYHLIEHFNKTENNIRVIYNSVDDSKYHVNVKKSELLKLNSIKNDPIIIGFIGRFDIKEKGIDILINSVSIISTKNENIFLLLVGDGKDYNTIKNLIAKTNIKYLFIPPQENIANYYNLIDIIILPSRIDPFPLVLLEAGIMRKPVIASDVDGIKELISDNVNGLLFPNEQSDKLAECINKMLFDESLRNILANQLFHDVKTKHNLKIMSQNYVNIYEKAYSKFEK